MLPSMKKLLVLAALTFAAPASAEVTRQTDSGFTVTREVTVDVAPDDAWKALVAPARWWNGEHSWSKDAANLYLIPQAGGCFCELLRNKGDDTIKTAGGSVRHMEVIFAQDGKLLRMSGALGPLQSEAVVGILTFTLKPAEKGTAISATYNVGGYMAYPVAEIAPAVDGMIGEQVNRLAELLAAPENSDIGK